MGNDDLRSWYLALTNSGKQIFLACVSHDLTLHGRSAGLYLSGEKQARTVLGLNDLQHQISGHIRNLGLGCDTKPDDTFLDLLIDEAGRFGLTARLRQSLEFARSRDLWQALKKPGVEN